ncbi:MAG: glycogen/starch/alpha-glucan phosphorylase, partial [Ruthenibacterium lactatiformans]
VTIFNSQDTFYKTPFGAVMADFADYRRAQNDLSGLYRDRGVWNRMSLMNIANAGIFSADRAVNDYARDIWHVKPIK